MNDRTLLYVAVLLTVASVTYWTAYAFNAFYTFHEYDDLGAYAYAMWYDIHYPGIVHGLQFIVFGNHIAPDQLMVLPIFYLWQSPLSLLFVQSVVVGITCFSAFLIARRLLNDSKLAFLVFLALLINPGLNGLNIFDYHCELFLVLFSILTFYFFMQKRTRPFLLSLVLLLFVQEAAAFVVFALGLGLLLYSLLYSDSRKQHIRMSAITLLAAILAFAFYHVATSALINAYASGAYPSLPPKFKVIPYYSQQLGNTAGTFAGSMHPFELLSAPPFYFKYLAYGILVVFLFLGVAVLFDPVLTIILASPWLTEVFLLNNFSFVVSWDYYMVFGLSGTVIGGILGLVLMKERKGVVAKVITRHKTVDYDALARKLAYYSIVFMTLFFFATYPLFVYSKNVNNIGQDLLFQVSPQIRAIDEQLYSVMALVPRNSSLMTDYFIMPHFTDMRYLEELGNSTLYFVPEYILFDFNLNISLNAYASVPFLVQYLRAHKYALYARNGTAYLLVRTNNSTGQ
ncbi:MAG: DUF2079 domain-containing protein [Candidatus Micrarchaeia archaeon]